jgi:large subunit ribosomal protein L24
MTTRLKKGDEVIMLSGKEKGKKSRILRVLPPKKMVIIEGLHLVKKHRRARKAGEKGQIVMIPRAIASAKVMLVCSKCSRPARVGFQLREGKKVRVCKKCGAELE